MSPFILRISLLPLAVLLILSLSCTRRDRAAPDCFINVGPCVRFVEGLTVTLDISPRPVRAMQDLAFSVQLKHGSQVVRDGEVAVDLTMEGMKMGENRVRLRRGEDGTYRGRGVIVRCPSGQTLWKASVIIDQTERVTNADFLLEVP